MSSGRGGGGGGGSGGYYGGGPPTPRNGRGDGVADFYDRTSNGHGGRFGGGGGGDRYPHHQQHQHSNNDRPRNYGGGGPYDNNGGGGGGRGGGAGGGYHHSGGGGGEYGGRGGYGRGGVGGGYGPPNRRHSNHHQQQQQQQQQPRKVPPNVISFQSADEEREWIFNRRHKRQARASRFDVGPSPSLVDDASGGMGQTSLVVPGQHATAPPFTTPFTTPTTSADPLHHNNPYTNNNNNNNYPNTMMLGANSSLGLPLQTRHARRLYVGNLPTLISEAQIASAFTEAIRLTLQPGPGVDVNDANPILSVYINQERRFCFLEFKSVELCSACMALDGLEVVSGQPPVKVKRPNDYQPNQAPPETFTPILDLSRLGIISPTVLDGPNKVFIGGLHYHLTDAQVLELLQAFGKVKAFHLVKNEHSDGMGGGGGGMGGANLSKGYCFVEYADPAVTLVAVAGLNGMDLGGGKSLTARLAGERSGGGYAAATPMSATAPTPSHTAAAMAMAPTLQPGQDKTIVAGYDIEALVDAAIGQGPMPLGPTFMDSFHQPLTRVIPILHFASNAIKAPPPPPPPPLALPALPVPNLPAVSLPAETATPTTRVLVLINMVTEEDLATEDDHQALVDEVREECAKFGVLQDVIIPRLMGSGVEASALNKVFLLYASTTDAMAAEKELSGRQFGSSVVGTHYYSEQEFIAGVLR